MVTSLNEIWSHRLGIKLNKVNKLSDLINNKSGYRKVLIHEREIDTRDLLLCDTAPRQGVDTR